MTDDDRTYALIPGDGWRVQYLYNDGEVFADEPIVAWVLTRDGLLTAYVHEEGGAAISIQSLGNKVAVYHATENALSQQQRNDEHHGDE